MMKPFSLYLHIPFCLHRCPYCNFYSTTELPLQEDYLQKLISAVQTAPFGGRFLRTVYFGGGTPSLLEDGLVSVLDAVRGKWPLAPDAEISLEANPGAVSLPLLKRLREAGFNRISFGLQSCDDNSLKRLGRIHDCQQGRDALNQARDAGFTNISADIMLGTPGQHLPQAIELVRQAVSFHVPHLSAYLLKIEPDTPFGKQHIETECPDPDETADIYLAVCSELEQAGYSHYEISNFALPGFESRHNSAYWTLSDYLGIGPAAYSCMDGERFHFPADLGQFLRAKDPWPLLESDGQVDDAEEFLMLSLRLSSGLDLAAAPKHGLSPERLLSRSRPLEKAGYLTIADGKIALTDTGFLVSNSIITALMDG